MTDERDTLSEDIRRYRKQLADAEARYQSARLEMESLRSVVSGLESLLGPQIRPRIDVGDSGRSVQELQGEPPRGSRAVLQLLNDAPPDREWTMVNVLAELDRRGWLNRDAKHPQAAARAALQRLVNEGVVERAGRSRFRLRPTGQAPQAANPVPPRQESPRYAPSVRAREESGIWNR